MDFSIHEIIEVAAKLDRGAQLIEFTCDKLFLKVNITITSFSEKSDISITEVEMLVGSKMKVTYYDKGEILKDGKTCKQIKSKIKGVEIIPADTIENMRIKNFR